MKRPSEHHQRVIDAYKRLGTGAAVGEEIGISRQRVAQILAANRVPPGTFRACDRETLLAVIELSTVLRAEDIAARLGIPERTARHRLARLRKRGLINKHFAAGIYPTPRAKKVL